MTIVRTMTIMNRLWLMSILLSIVSRMAIAQYPNPAFAQRDEGERQLRLPYTTARIGSPGSSAVLGASETAIVPSVPLAPTRIPGVANVPVLMPNSLSYRPPPPPVRREARSQGRCLFDASAWKVEPESSISMAIMFDRTTGISCTECLTKCQRYQDPTTKWICRTLTYDHRWKICDLFAINGSTYPYFLSEYKGRDYFEYLAAQPITDMELQEGNIPLASSESSAEFAEKEKPKPESTKAIEPTVTSAPSTIPTTTIPIVPVTSSSSPSSPSTIAPSSPATNSPSSPSTPPRLSGVKTNSGAVKSGPGSCGPDEESRYTEWLGKAIGNPKAQTRFVNAANQDACLAACDAAGNDQCASLMTSAEGACELSTFKANHSLIGDLVDMPESIYMEKSCLPSVLLTGDAKVFPAVKNRILVGHVLEVADASTLQDCQLACLRAERDHGFMCQSAMWYPADADQNCLLNSESRLTLPDVFVPEEEGVQMIYFEIPKNPLSANAAMFRLKDSPIGQSKYTRWSQCSENPTATRHRYLKCREKKDIRRCPKETMNCQQATEVECIAVRDSSGNKRCPHGVRQQINGVKEYCRNPIDC